MKFHARGDIAFSVGVDVEDLGSRGHRDSCCNEVVEGEHYAGSHTFEVKGQRQTEPSRP